jgi:hypothetical protein
MRKRLLISAALLTPVIYTVVIIAAFILTGVNFLSPDPYQSRSAFLAGGCLISGLLTAIYNAYYKA